MKKFLTSAMVALAAIGVVVPTVVSAQEDDFSTVMITDQGGVDDKSFNQSAWEGIQEWGQANGLEEGVNGYHYLQSNTDSDYITNLNNAISANFDLIFGIGFKLEAAVQQIAEQNPEQHFAMVDANVDLPNVVSANFKDHEAAFLAGVAAAMSTETNHVGFVGGVESVIIDRFEAGFVEGVKAVNPDVEISVEYVGSFADASQGKQLAAAMYANGADIIFQAAGDSGNGVFSEARDLVTADPSKNIYVIGVDRDQEEEGLVEVDGEERRLTLTSTLKGIGPAVKTLLDEAKAGNFQAGNRVFGLAEDGVGITEGQLSEDVLTALEDYKAQIIAGEIEIPETPER